MKRPVGRVEAVGGGAGPGPSRGSGGDVFRPVGWRSRGYLPHFDRPGLVQMVTFRLADALPSDKREELEQDLRDATEDARRRRIEEYLNAGFGACFLKDPRIARVVEEALLHFDGVRYRLFAWVVMLNHVHVLAEPLPGWELASIVHSWKSYTANRANRALGRRGPFWQVEYFDRAIRDEKHLNAALEYIRGNPVKAGLVDRPEDWPYTRLLEREPGG